MGVEGEVLLVVGAVISVWKAWRDVGKEVLAENVGYIIDFNF